ncbi:MAG: ribbon-helix-helix protein, CopG family [Chloroflexi bacterium]|nr:ribbon-helix-helix protein, CopG family [Chloroflexota bacterium]
MRTTVTFDRDIAAAIDRLKRKEGIGVSEAVNRLARLGLTARETPKAFRQQSVPMGAYRLDVTDIGEALEIAEGDEHR